MLLPIYQSMRYNNGSIGHEGSDGPHGQPVKQELSRRTEIQTVSLLGGFPGFGRKWLPTRTGLVLRVFEGGIDGGGSNTVGSEGNEEEDDQDDGGGEMDVDKYALSSPIRYCWPQSQIRQGKHCSELCITTD